jgi:thioredoxin-like negative regulator of GroEL
LAEDFDIQNLPTLVILEDNKIIYKKEGITEIDTIKKFLGRKEK